MDISVPSNFERLAFEVSGRDPEMLRGLYERFAQTGDVELPEQISGPLRCSGLSGASVSNGETLSEMSRAHDETGWLICPHTAVGTHVARAGGESDVTDVVLATAHAAKFPETVKKAVGRDCPLPDRVAGLADKKEVFERLPSEVSNVRRYIRENRRH